MKKCPYCAEMIQDEAIICRYCHSDLREAPPPETGRTPGAPETPSAPEEESAPVGAGSTATQERQVHYPWSAASGATDPASTPAAPPAVPAGPRVGEGALRFSHSGERYILGYGADFFGIWDRLTPGGPAERFPRTDEGWTQAWSRYSVMEPRSMAVPTGGTPPPDLRAGAFTPYRDTRGPTNAITWLIAASAVAYAVTIITRAMDLSLLTRARHEFVSFGEAKDAADRVGAVVGVAGFIFVAAGIVWCVWQHRSQRNLQPLGSSDLRFTPGWAVGWWFIPVANTVMPFRAMRELWKASEPGAGSVDWKLVRTPLVMVFWWAAWLGNVIPATIAATTGGEHPTLSQLILRQQLLITANGLLILAGILAIQLVRGIHHRQAEKHRRMSAWSQTGTPG